MVNYDSLKIVLEEIYDKDQGIREKVSNMNPYDAELVYEMNQADSINQIKIQKIIDTYGWPGKSKVGEKASRALFYVIQHADLELIEKYFPYFQKATEQGEANPLDFATMEDRMRMYQGKKQIYGTQAHGTLQDDGTFDFFIWPIENPAKVNERRKKLGFKKTVEQIAEEMEARYDPNELLPEENR